MNYRSSQPFIVRNEIETTISAALQKLTKNYQKHFDLIMRV